MKKALKESMGSGESKPPFSLLLLSRIAARKPLIKLGGVQAVNGKSKWRNENFDHCFDDVGGRQGGLSTIGISRTNVDQEGGRMGTWLYFSR